MIEFVEFISQFQDFQQKHWCYSWVCFKILRFSLESLGGGGGGVLTDENCWPSSASSKTKISPCWRWVSASLWSPTPWVHSFKLHNNFQGLAVVQLSHCLPHWWLGLSWLICPERRLPFPSLSTLFETFPLLPTGVKTTKKDQKEGWIQESKC